MITIEQLKQATVNQVIEWLREAGIDLSPAKEVELAFLLGAKDNGILVSEIDRGKIYKEIIDWDALLRLVNRREPDKDTVKNITGGT